jgi:archaellum biogenesis ATPase FlaH
VIAEEYCMSHLEEKLKAVPPKSVIVIEVSPEEDQMRVVADFMKLKQNGKGIYVSSNRPANDLIEKLLSYDVDLKKTLETNKTCIIDLMSRSVGASEVKGGIYVSSPSELSAAQMAIEKAFETVNGKAGRTWLLLDSISTLLVFNTPGAVLHFIHFLIGRLRVLQFDGVLFTVEGSVDERTLSTIRQFCDMVIKA